MSRYTPGPWTATVDDDGGNLIVIGAGDAPVVHGCGCCSSPYTESARAHANAALIAAAPDLLGALIRLTHMVAIVPPDMTEPASAVGEARAAIFKATGNNSI